jgi:hypothetical protein
MQEIGSLSFCHVGKLFQQNYFGGTAESIFKSMEIIFIVSSRKTSSAIS